MTTEFIQSSPERGKLLLESHVAPASGRVGPMQFLLVQPILVRTVNGVGGGAILIHADWKNEVFPEVGDFVALGSSLLSSQVKKRLFGSDAAAIFLSNIEFWDDSSDRAYLRIGKWIEQRGWLPIWADKLIGSALDFDQGSMVFPNPYMPTANAMHSSPFLDLVREQERIVYES